MTKLASSGAQYVCMTETLGLPYAGACQKLHLSTLKRATVARFSAPGKHQGSAGCAQSSVVKQGLGTSQQRLHHSARALALRNCRSVFLEVANPTPSTLGVDWRLLLPHLLSCQGFSIRKEQDYPGAGGFAEVATFKKKPRQLQASSDVFHWKQLRLAEKQRSLG